MVYVVQAKSAYKLTTKLNAMSVQTYSQPFIIRNHPTDTSAAVAAGRTEDHFRGRFAAGPRLFRAGASSFMGASGWVKPSGLSEAKSSGSSVMGMSGA